MTPDGFMLAQHMEDEGWEYLGVSEQGNMIFTLLYSGVQWVADVREDR